MRAECKDNAIRLVVEDDGPGIAPADIACVLEPFGQAGGPETQGKTGTGLGLPLAKGFMELHGGALTLTSEVGKGTQVALSFPPERTRTR